MDKVKDDDIYMVHCTNFFLKIIRFYQPMMEIVFIVKKLQMEKFRRIV